MRFVHSLCYLNVVCDAASSVGWKSNSGDFYFYSIRVGFKGYTNVETLSSKLSPDILSIENTFESCLAVAMGLAVGGRFEEDSAWESECVEQHATGIVLRNLVSLLPTVSHL